MSVRKQMKSRGLKPRRQWVLQTTTAEMRKQQAVGDALPAPAREAERILKGTATHHDMAKWIANYLEENPGADNAEKLREVCTRFEKFHAASELMRENRIPDATALFQEIIAAEPQDLLSKLNLAQCLVTSGQNESALVLLDELEPVYRFHIRYIMTRARVLMALNRREEGIKLLKVAYSRSAKNLSLQQELVRLGELIPVEQDARDISKTKYMSREKYVDALRAEVDRQFKADNKNSLQIMAKSQLDANLNEVAAYAGGKLLQLEPGSVEGLVMTAQAESRLGQYAAAEEKFRAAIAVEPNHVEAMSGLAFALMQTNRKDEAREVLNKALEANPNSTHTAEMYVLLNEDDESRFAAARELQQRFPDAWLPIKLLGDLDVRFGMIEQALAKHTEAYEKSNSDDALTMILHDLDRLDRIHEAVSIVEQTKDLLQRNLTVRWNAASIFLKAGRLNHAAAVLQNIIRDRRLPPETRFSANVLLAEVFAAG